MTQTGQSNHPQELQSSQPADDGARATFRNGLVGGVAAVLLAFLPLSTVLGGGIAGYLQAPASAGAGTAGAIAGAIGIIPHVIVGAYLIRAPDYVPPGPEVGLAPEYLMVGVIGFGIIYAVGLGVLGGLLGAYVRSRHR